MESEDFVFVKFRSKITYCFWKVSAWLSKLDGANMEGFLGKRSFFLVESMFSRLFLDIRQMFFELWKQIVKIVSLSVQMNFSWKNFTPGKMLKLIVFFRTGAGVGGGWGWGFGILWKNGFLAENCQASYQNGTQRFQSDFLRKDVFFRKTSNEYFFQTFSIILVFCRFLACLSKKRPRVHMNLLRKIFFD